MTWRAISARPYISVVFGNEQSMDYRLNTVDHVADTRGPGRKPVASLYTREGLSSSRGPGRTPGASVYTQKRLSLSHATDLIIAAGVKESKAGLCRYPLRRCALRIIRHV